MIGRGFRERGEERRDHGATFIVHLIPTSTRDKIGAPLSYPIGTEAISRGLDGVPHLASLWASFYAHRFRDSIAPAGEVLTLSYSPALYPPGKYSSLFSEPTWRIAVYAVSRTERHNANVLLKSEGLPAARAWLSVARPETWYNKRHQISFVYVGGSRELHRSEDGGDLVLLGRVAE